MSTSSRRFTMARLADMAAWEALQKANREMQEAAFNLGDDLDRVADAAAKLQQAALDMKLAQYRRELAKQMDEKERAVALDYDDDEMPDDVRQEAEAEVLSARVV